MTFLNGRCSIVEPCVFSSELVSSYWRRIVPRFDPAWISRSSPRWRDGWVKAKNAMKGQVTRFVAQDLGI